LIAEFLESTSQRDLLYHLWPSAVKVPESRKKNFYIFDRSFGLQELLQSKLGKNKAFNKILCFHKNDPLLGFTNEIEKQCLNVTKQILSTT
jgi:hypothetical protein